MSCTSLLAQGFLLGLASGVTCLASCAPVLLPLLAGPAAGRRSAGRLLGEYLTGRLLGYLSFGALIWGGSRGLAGMVASEHPALRGAVSLTLGGLMLFHGVRLLARETAPVAPTAGGHAACLVSPWQVRTQLGRQPWLIPAALGLASGLSLCPPFLVALAQGGLTTRFGGLLLFFASFFVATSLFFLPLPLLGGACRRLLAGPVAGFASLLVGLYYAYVGAAHFIHACFLP